MMRETCSSKQPIELRSQQFGTEDKLVAAEDGIPAHIRQDFAPKAAIFCVVVVVINEGDRIRSQLDRMAERSDLADIVIADGGSDDGSLDAEHLSKCGVRSLLMTQEKGLSTATRMGIAYALAEGYEGMVTVDGNGKDGVEALPQFLESLREGYHLIQGSRFRKGGYHRHTPLSRLIGIRFVFSPILWLFGGVFYTDPTNAFRAMSADFLKDIRVQPLRKVFVRFNLQIYLIYRAAKLGFRIREIPVRRVYPESGDVPTKIVGWRSNWLLLRELLSTVTGKYNPG